MNKETIYKELHFKAVRSSGAGGQHVNKVSSKVELYFDLASSEAFTEKEKQLLLKNLSNMSRAQKIKRLDNKTKHATKKILRKKPTLE